MRRGIGILCLILGTVFLLAAGGLVFYNQEESRSAMESSHEVLTVMKPQMEMPTDSYDGRESVEYSDYVDYVDVFDQEAKEMTVKEIDGQEYIGYLSIPVLELELPVISEWDYDRLKIAPCRQYGSTKTDDLVIAAHNYASHFGRLAQLRTGDLLTFTDMDAETILYGVVTVDILEPTAVDTVKDSEFDLVLYTCTYGGENRVAVFCDRIVR